MTIIKTKMIMKRNSLLPAMNVPSLCAEAAMSMREEKAPRHVLGAKLDIRGTQVSIFLLHHHIYS